MGTVVEVVDVELVVVVDTGLGGLGGLVGCVVGRVVGTVVGDGAVVEVDVDELDVVVDEGDWPSMFPSRVGIGPNDPAYAGSSLSAAAM